MPQTSIQSKRYRLHQIIKDHFNYCSRNKVVYLKDNHTPSDYPKQVQTALKELQRLNYSLQTQVA